METAPRRTVDRARRYLGNGGMFELLMKLRFVRRQARRLEKKRIRKQIRESADAEEAFRLIYKSNYWGSAESISGNGSTLASTEVFRAEFEPLLHSRRVATLFDAPCGDFNWMKQVKFPSGMKYIGADIVGELIDSLNCTYRGDPSKTFLVMDIINEDHPKSDLWLCRDGLFHFSYADIFRTFERFLRSGTPYCLLTTHPYISHNVDIKTGLHREINLLEPPFRLPKPEVALHDAPQGESERVQGLWRNDDIAEAVRRARASAPL
jgi:hypothetical protein